MKKNGDIIIAQIFFKQESPPAWTQEAHRPPRSRSKCLLFREGEGGSLCENFFSSLNMYQAKSGVKNFSLYWGRGGCLCKNFFSSLNMYQAKSGVKIFFPLLVPPPPLEMGPPPVHGWIGTPPVHGWIGYPPPSKAGSGPPLPKCEQTETITLPPSFGWRAVTNEKEFRTIWKHPIQLILRHHNTFPGMYRFTNAVFQLVFLQTYWYWCSNGRGLPTIYVFHMVPKLLR